MFRHTLVNTVLFFAPCYGATIQAKANALVKALVTIPTQRGQYVRLVKVAKEESAAFKTLLRVSVKLWSTQLSEVQKAGLDKLTD